MSAKCQKSRSIAVAAGITIARADSSRVYAVVRYRSLSYPWPTVTRVLPCVLKKMFTRPKVIISSVGITVGIA